MNIFGFRPFKGRFNLGNSDDIPTNTYGTLIGAVKQVDENLSVFSFRNNNGTAQYSMDDGATWKNFSSGAVLVGTYSANTSIDVSAYGATSADQFMLVPYTSKSSSSRGAVATQQGNYWLDAEFTFYSGSLSLTNSTLSISLPSVTSYAYVKSVQGTAGSQSTSAKIPCRLYFIAN